MKKYIFVITFVITVFFTFVSCNPEKDIEGSGISKEKLLTLDLSSFNSFRLELSGAKSLGIIDNESLSSSKSISGASFFLAKTDEKGNVSPVEFVATQRTTILGKTVEAGESILIDNPYIQADKLFVDKDFSLISFSLKISDDDPRVGNRTSNIIFDPTVLPEYYVRSIECYGNISVEDPVSQEIQTISLSIQNNGVNDARVDIRPEVDVSTAIEGLSIFDSYGYCSNDLRQSFIVDNHTGKLYRIENLEISVKNGIPYSDSDGPLRFKVDGNGSLVINRLIPNSEMTVYTFFKDKYDQVFVYTKSVPDFTDEELNVHYYNEYNKYIMAEDGTTYRFNDAKTNDYAREKPFSSVLRIGDGFSETAIGPEETIVFNCFWGAGFWHDTMFLDKIDKNVVYMHGHSYKNGNGTNDIYIFGEDYQTIYTVGWNYYDYGALLTSVSGLWFCLDGVYYRSNFQYDDDGRVGGTDLYPGYSYVSYSETSGGGQLGHCSILDNPSLFSKILPENYESISYHPQNDGTTLIQVKYQYISGSVTYDVFEDVEGLHVLETGSYTAPTTPVSVFHPIN